MRIERDIKLSDSQMSLTLVHDGEVVKLLASSASVEQLFATHLPDGSFTLEANGPYSFLVGDMFRRSALCIVVTVSWDIDSHYAEFLSLQVKVKKRSLSVVQIYDGPDDLAIMWKLMI